jgi:hypothetical protein
VVFNHLHPRHSSKLYGLVKSLECNWESDLTFEAVNTMGVVMSLLFGVDDDGIDHAAIKNAEVYDTALIGYGPDGNLRFGRKPRDRKAEMKMFSEPGVDDTVEANGKKWYVMDGPWMESWLAFLSASNEDYTLPDPGPCDNSRLLQHNDNFDGWVAREGIQQASAKDAGDYRRVSQAAWELYIKCYPGSGPAIIITTVLPELDVPEDGDEGSDETKASPLVPTFLDDDEGEEEVDPYSPTLWEIDQTTYEPPPNVEELLKQKAVADDMEYNLKEEIATAMDVLRLQNHGQDSDDDVDSDDDGAPVRAPSSTSSPAPAPVDTVVDTLASTAVAAPKSLSSSAPIVPAVAATRRIPALQNQAPDSDDED